MRIVKLLLVCLAVFGTGALVFASRAQARPSTAIGAIAPSMNFAYVRVEGVLTAYPTLSPAGDYLAFRLRDDTGELRVTAYRAAAATLLRDGRVPMPGDRVAVEGTLRVRDDEPALTLNTAEAMTVSPSRAAVIDLAGLQAMRVGERVTTIGQVRRVRAAGGLMLISLRHGDAEADLVFPAELAPVFGDTPQLAPGQWVRVTAGVGEYRQTLQMLPASAADVSPIPAPDAPETRPIGALSRQMLGRWVTVRGLVQDVSSTRAATRIDLEDDTGAITLTLFDVWHAVPFSATLKPGDALIASGALAEFRGALEMQPEHPFDLVPAPADTAPHAPPGR